MAKNDPVSNTEKSPNTLQFQNACIIFIQAPADGADHGFHVHRGLRLQRASVDERAGAAPLRIKPGGGQESQGLALPGQVTSSILFCGLFKIKDQWKQVRFQQTHNQGLRQLFLTVSWDLRA